MTGRVCSTLMGCLLIFWTEYQAQAQVQSPDHAKNQDFAVLDASLLDGQRNLDVEALIKQNKERLSKRRRAFAEAETLGQAIELARGELEQQGLQQFGSLLTEDNVVFALERSLEFQRQSFVKRIRKQVAGEPPAVFRTRVSEFETGPAAAFKPVIDERRMPPGSFFSYEVRRLENGQVLWFTLRLSVKPKQETGKHPGGLPLLEHLATVASVRFGDPPGD